MFSDNSYLSAILVDKDFWFAAPIDLRTKKAEHFTPQLLQGFWYKLKKKNPKIVLMSPTVTMKRFKQKEVVWQQYHLCLAVAEQHILDGLTLSYFGTRARKDLVVETGAIPSEKYHCQWTFLRGKKPKWIFHNLGNLSRPLESIPASRE